MIPEYNIKAEDWQAYVNQTLTKAKLPLETPISLMLYTDGGCKPTPNGVAGWGVHGYAYVNVPPKVGHGCKGFTPTATGYTLHTQGNVDVIKAKGVTVLAYFDGSGAAAAPQTNNAAELRGMVHALDLVETIKPMSCHFKLDSKYVLNNAMEQRHVWKKNDWRLKSGEPVKNLELWQAVDKKLDGLPVNFTWEWVKGHSTDIGNNRADKLASESVNAGLRDQVYSRTLMTEPREQWNKERKYHSFLYASKWYYSTKTTNNVFGDYYFYHIGNHDKDDSEGDTEGKRISDAYFSVVALKKPDPALETLKNFHSEKLRDYGVVNVIGFMDGILSPSTYERLEEGHTFFMEFDEKAGDLVTTEGMVLTHELWPHPGLSHRAVAEFQSLEMVLRDYLSGDLPENHVLNNITDLFYETVVEKKQDVTKLKIPVGKEFTRHVISVKYSTITGIQTSDVIVSMGYDLPSRNVLLGVASAHPEVYLLTWPAMESTCAFHYACLVKSDEGVGLWVRPYSNLRIVA